MIHLHCRSWFSFLAGGSSPEALVKRAQELGHPAIALTDLHGVQGAVRFGAACRQAGIKPLYGTTLIIDEEGSTYPLVLIAENEQGYDNLCQLASAAHLNARPSPLEEDEEAPPPPSGAYAPILRYEQLRAAPKTHLFCLTGGPEGRLGLLLKESRLHAAEQWLERMRALFPQKLHVELVHRMQPGDGPLIRQMARLAAWHGIPIVATNAVRYATPDDFPRYDALTCVRLGITVGDRHPERPVNDHAHLLDEEALRLLIPFPEAFTAAERIAASCDLDLLPGEVTPPTALLPPGTDAHTYLRALCLQ